MKAKKVFEFLKTGDVKSGLNIGIIPKVKEISAKLPWLFSKSGEYFNPEILTGLQWIKFIYYGILNMEYKSDVLKWILNNYFKKISDYLDENRPKDKVENPFYKFWIKIFYEMYIREEPKEYLDLCVSQIDKTPDYIRRLNREESDALIKYLMASFKEGKAINEFHKTGDPIRGLNVGQLAEMRKSADRIAHNWETDAQGLYYVLKYFIGNSIFKSYAEYIMEKFKENIENFYNSIPSHDLWMFDFDYITKDLILGKYDDKYIMMMMKLYLKKADADLSYTSREVRDAILRYLLDKYLSKEI